LKTHAAPFAIFFNQAASAAPGQLSFQHIISA
ncbi:hypothetical protein T08_12176, partial [Trichinella sp. T8]